MMTVTDHCDVAHQCFVSQMSKEFPPLPSIVVSPLPKALDSQGFPTSQDSRVPHVTPSRPLEPLPPPRFFPDTRGARGARGLLLQLFLLLHLFRLSLLQLVHLILQDMDPVLEPAPSEILPPLFLLQYFDLLPHLGDLSRQISKLLHGLTSPRPVEPRNFTTSQDPRVLPFTVRGLLGPRNFPMSQDPRVFPFTLRSPWDLRIFPISEETRVLSLTPPRPLEYSADTIWFSFFEFLWVFAAEDLPRNRRTEI